MTPTQPGPAGGTGPDESVNADFGGAELDLPLILPGGKVNPDAIRAAYERAAERGAASDGGDMPGWRVTFELRRDLQTRLDKYLTSRICFMSRNQLQRLIDTGGVKVNARAARPATKLRSGDTIEVLVPPPPSKDLLPQEIAIEVLHEDRHLIVLNKAADIIVHPARAEKSGTLVNALAWHFKHQSATGGELSPVGADEARPGVVHRLDRDTTGVIVFAKDEESHWKLGRQWEERTVDKRYLAVCEGRVETPHGEGVEVIDEPIGPHPSKEKGYREKQVIRRDDLGKPSVTIMRVRERYECAGRAYSLVELELKTGRTHQIRVHLSHRGHPIVGDDMYGGSFFDFPDHGERIERQMLHAGLLAFDHTDHRRADDLRGPAAGRHAASDRTAPHGRARPHRAAGLGRAREIRIVTDPSA